VQKIKALMKKVLHHSSSAQVCFQNTAVVCIASIVISYCTFYSAPNHIFNLSTKAYYS